MNIAILTAGGVGSRTNLDVPKQFLFIKNKPILIYTLEKFQNHPLIDEIYVACLEGWDVALTAYAKQFKINKLKKIVIGGRNGQESIYNCLKAIHESNYKDVTCVIHDGNRPLVTEEIITNNLKVQQKYGSAVTAIPTHEVVFVSKDGIESTLSLDRSELYRTQTPHSYKFDEIWKIHNLALKDGIDNTIASCDLMQKYGYKIYFSKGSEKNIKITTQEDIEIFKALLNAETAETKEL